MKDNLFGKTLQGLQWTTISTVVSTLIQIVHMALASRMLSSEAFGTIALANTIVGFSYFFSNLGVGQALVQKEELTEKDISVLFFISVFAATTVFSILWISIPYLIRSMYPASDIDALSLVARLMSFGILLSGIGTVPGAMIRRSFDFKRGAILFLLISVANSVIILSFAYSGFGVWSLVIGALAQGSLATISNFYLIRRWYIKPIFSFKEIKPFLGYSTHLSLISILEYVNQNMDQFLIGRFSGAVKVGLYTRVNLLFYLPSYYLTTTISRVFFPAMSRMQDNRMRMQSNFIRIIVFLSIIMLPLAGGVAIAAENVILVALGTKQNWVAGADVLRIYGFASVLSMVTMQSGIICDATAYLKPKLILNISHFFIMGILFYLFRSYDLVGFAFALLCAEIIRNIGYSFLMRKVLNLNPFKYYASLLPAVIICTLVSASIYGTTLVCKLLELNYFIQFIFQIITGAIVLVGSILFLPIPIIRREIKWLLEKKEIKLKNPKIAKFVDWYIYFLDRQAKPI
jgi:lipopolysaccharide exporter